MRNKWTFVGFFKALLFCLLCLSEEMDLSGPEMVTAASGGSVTIACHYDQMFKENEKYWCKGPRYARCVTVVRTPNNRISDRSSIADDIKAGVISVTMHSLSKNDEDVYWCVISRFGKNVFTRVSLLISETVPTISTPATFPFPLTGATLQSVEKNEISWWETLRWILFVLMLCCLVLTQIIVWRIKAAKKIPQQHQVLHQTLNMS